VAPAPAKEGPINARDAMRSVVDWRRKSAANQQTDDGGQRTDEGAADSASSDPSSVVRPPSSETDTAAETPPRETESADPVVETQPPIEPPRSWSKEDKEL